MTTSVVHQGPAPVSGSHGLDVIRQRELDRSLGGTGSAWAVETLSDEQFKLMLELDKKKQERVREIVLNRLQEGSWEEGADFGTVPGISKPFCWESGADKIANLFRWSPRPVGDTAFTYDGEVLTASVRVTVFDLSGRELASATRACSTREKRFKNQKSGKWKFDDPRECVNETATMAQKRAKVAAVLSAAGAKKYFSNPDQLRDDADVVEEVEPTPWTDEEKDACYLAAAKAGIKTPDEFKVFVKEILGRAFVGTVGDVQVLLEALAKRKSA